MKYRVLFAHTTGDLEAVVMDMLAKGWSLQGGVCVLPGSGYYQAMVK